MFSCVLLRIAIWLLFAIWAVQRSELIWFADLKPIFRCNMFSLILYFSVIAVKEPYHECEPCRTINLLAFVLQYLLVNAYLDSYCIYFLCQSFTSHPMDWKIIEKGELVHYKHWGCERPPAPCKSKNLGSRGGLSRVTEAARQSLIGDIGRVSDLKL